MAKKTDISSYFRRLLIEWLSEEGQAVVDRAYLTKETRDRSGTQHDAYGYAVYSDGRIVSKGYASGGRMSSKVHHGWAKYNIPADTGRGYLESFFADYGKSVVRKGIVLVCVNAAYYSQILEEGAQGRPGRQMSVKYRIISQIGGDMRRIASDFGGTRVSVISPSGSFGDEGGI